MSRINYFQPIYFDYKKKLIEKIAGYVMPFPHLDKFKLHYGNPEDNAPTQPLLDTLRLLLPQIRVINNLIVDGQPNPAAFLAYKTVPTDILALIFRRWVEVCYPESEHQALLPLCEDSQFDWSEATPEHLEYWAPSWAIALKLTQHEYQLGDNSFKFLFGPGRSKNTVELVSWPPFSSARGYRASIAVIISTQSDIDPQRINLHFRMKRWVVKRGNDSKVGLLKGTTRCYVRRLRPWSDDDNFPLEPNAFTVFDGNYRFENNDYIPQWKSPKIKKIFKLLAVEIPEITDVLANPTDFIDTKQIDILIPARSYQKAGWGTGVPFSDERKLLEQILDVLPSEAILTAPWIKIPIVKELKKSIDQRFQKTPNISKPSKGKLPEINKELQQFLAERANNLTIRVCDRTKEVREALERVAQHYFGDSLTLEFQTGESLADPISEKKSKKRNGTVPETKHIKQFGEQNQPTVPTPIIVEILSPDHPSYSQGKDPKSYIKSILPQYNLIPQCILSSESVKRSDEQETVESDEERQKSLDYRALSAILDAILPFNPDYPLSIFEGEFCKDNTVYAGFYVIRRNQQTAKQNFSEPVLFIIYKNKVSVLLPARDLTFRSMADSICKLAQQKTPKADSEQVINNMLSTLTQTYSSADDIYLFAHAQNARSYWTWLQDSKFDPENPPSKKIHIIRIRDESNYEAPEGYGLSTEEEAFEEGNASFGQGIFIPKDYKIETETFTQTVFSVAQKPDTIKLGKQMSRFQPWASRGDVSHNPSPTQYWKAPQTRAHNILATPSPEKFKLHHAIAHNLRSCHWWTNAECKYPVLLSLAQKLKEWCCELPQLA